MQGKEIEQKIDELINKTLYIADPNMEAIIVEAILFGQSRMKQRVKEKANSMKKILWNNDIKKHTENITRHNTLNEILEAMEKL